MDTFSSTVILGFAGSFERSRSRDKIGVLTKHVEEHPVHVKGRLWPACQRAMQRCATNSNGTLEGTGGSSS